MTDQSAARRRSGPLSSLGLSIILTVVIVDQIAKFVAERTLVLGEVIDLLPFLSLLRTHNRGIAFSLLDGFGSIVLVAVVLAVSATVLWIWARAEDGSRMTAVGYALIIGGAIGNLIDRVRFGYVIDYLFLHLDVSDNRIAFFIFNIADAALTLGPGLLILALFQSRDSAKG